MIRRTLLGIALSVLATTLTAQTPPADPLDALMHTLAQRREGQADFQSEQYLSVLKQPLHSSGVLSYVAPDHLEQRTLTPRPADLVLDHGELTISSGKHSRRLTLQDDPQLAALIDSIRATLAGDRAALERVFDVQMQGDLAHWTLRLNARDAQLAATLSGIEIQGEQADVRMVRVQQRNGDHSVLHIQPRD